MLEIMAKDNCPFCSLNERVLKENDKAILFLSNPRIMEGHFLISPKRHVEKPWELTNDEVSSIFNLVRLVQEFITENLTDGCDVRQNYRPFLKQSKLKVNHVHYHVMPRNFEDELYQKVEKHETQMFKDLGNNEHERIAKMLEEAL